MIAIIKITSLLKDFDVNYTIIGSIEVVDGFKSFYAVEPRGLYYCKGCTSFGGIFPNKSIIVTNKYEAKLAKQNTLIIVEADPQLVFYKLINSVHSRRIVSAIHPTAIVNENAQLGKHVQIGAYSVVGDCIIGDNSFIDSHVVINDNTVIGRNVQIESSTSIGARGMAWIWDRDGGRVVQPQIGGTIIEDDCIIGTNITIVRGSINENTIIGLGTMMAHGTKIGHGSQLGAYNHFANNVSIAGNVRCGAKCFFGSGSVVRPGVRLGSNMIIGAGAVVVKNYLADDAVLAGVPAKVLKRNNGKDISGVPDIV